MKSKTVPKHLDASSDPNRPTYHCIPDSSWMNDTNGAVWHNGWYHLFYLYSPGQDRPFPTDPKWISKVWGHARSKDLVQWETLPIALVPNDPNYRCMSGSSFIRKDGQPLIIYSYAPIMPNQGSTLQQLAYGDSELIQWTLHPNGPILDLESHDGPKFREDWRDPYVFSHKDRVFQIIGAFLDNQAVIAIYENGNEGLTEWNYRGIFFSLPTNNITFFECPKFFKLVDKWVLVVSPHLVDAPHGSVQYFIGSFDLDDLIFKSEYQGTIDYGDCFYAAEDIATPFGEKLLLGWVPGWDMVYHIGHGWNGFVSLPRKLSLNRKGCLLQKPLSGLSKLRGTRYDWSNFHIKNEIFYLNNIQCDTFELKIEYGRVNALSFGLNVRLSEVDNRSIEIAFDQYNLKVADNIIPLSRDEFENLSLHIFLDKCVLELFLNNGKFCLTHLFEADSQDLSVALFASGGEVEINDLHLWELSLLHMI
jgi:beta-fructofuranosidase